MKYWASNIAVIPLERGPCPAPAAMAEGSEWLSFDISSWMRCGEHPRRLFLQLLFGSIFLIVGSAQVQASGIVYKCMRVYVYTSGPSLDANGVQTPGFRLPISDFRSRPPLSVRDSLRSLPTSDFASTNGQVGPHFGAETEECLPACPSSVAEADRQWNLWDVGRSEKSPSWLSPKSEIGRRKAENGPSVLIWAPIPTSHFPLPTSHFRLRISDFAFPTSDFRLPTSNGALLAYQTTSITNPLPTARNGVAARTPLPEAGERRKKMFNHFQICTKGYLASPGIPKPASGLWVRPRKGNCVKVEYLDRNKEIHGNTWKYIGTYRRAWADNVFPYFDVCQSISVQVLKCVKGRHSISFTPLHLHPQTPKNHE